jgi:uncharacterized repeat protein (TIGR01451 family)
MKILLLMLMLTAPAAALANDIALTSSVFVEQVKQDPSGKRTTVLAPPTMVTPGDRLLFVLSWQNGGGSPASDFVVTNPIPESVLYAGADGDGAAVSVDGGRSWGTLASLQVRQVDGTLRPAVAADVTHVRWSFSKPIAAGATGKLSFRGVVR